MNWDNDGENGENPDDIYSFSVLAIDFDRIITEPLTIAANDPTFDELALYIRDIIVTVDGSHTFSSIHLEDEGTITHYPDPDGQLGNRIDLTIMGDLTVDAGGRISADGLGYGTLAGPEPGQNDPQWDVHGSGGGHGGVGGECTPTASGGGVYGSVTEPEELGSGGGGTNGGAGGGILRIAVGGTFELNGEVTADGAVGGSRGGGGAGGSIQIHAGVITGTGAISADGGDAGDSYGGGGGGGRIAVYYADISGFTENNIAAAGGWGHEYGEDGTIFLYPLQPLHLLYHSPDDTGNQPVQNIVLTFDKTIEPETFTVEDVEFYDPNGLEINISIESEPVDAEGKVWQISFPAQTVEGEYHLYIGPHITGISGHEMDQNLNGVEGEYPADIYEGSFIIDTSPPEISFHIPVEAHQPVNHIKVTFNEEIDSDTFGVYDVTITGPSGSIPINEIKPTPGIENAWVVTFPTQDSEGLYNISIGPDIQDSAGNTMEIPYNGNFTLALPDLTIQNIIVNPVNPESGSGVTVSWQVHNSGSGIVDVLFYDIIEVVNTTTGDTTFGGIVTHDPSVDGSIAVGQWCDHQISFKLPYGTAGIGDFEITITADYNNQVIEYNSTGDAESNNSANSTFSSVSQPYADLVIAPVNPPSQVIIGKQVQLEWTVTNTQNATSMTPVTIWHDRVILSADTEYGNGDDRVLGTFAHTGALDIGDSYATPAQGLVLIPADLSGTCYLFFVTNIYDDVYEYVYEYNNVSAPVPTELVGPDLQVTDITWDSGPFHDGQQIQISALVENPTQISFSDAFFVRLEVDGDFVGRQLVTGISANGDVLVEQDWVASGGSHTVRVVADEYDGIAEIDENNNEMSQDGLEVLSPDLIINDISWSPTAISDGEDVTLTASVYNNGPGDTSRGFHVRFEVDGNLVGRQLVTGGITEDTTMPVTLSQKWQAEPGDHNISVYVDEYDVVKESDENNNIAIQLLPNIPASDLVVTDLSWIPETIHDGETVTLTATVENTQTDGTTLREFYVSFDINGVGLGQIQVNGLTSGGEVPVSIPWTSSVGTHTLRAVVDSNNYVTEENEDNNERSEALPSILDETAPVILSLTPGDGAKVHATELLELDTSDNIAVIQYLFEVSDDEVNWDTLSSGLSASAPWDTTKLEDGGTYFVCATASDAVGNSSSVTHTYRIDNTGAGPVTLSAQDSEFCINLNWTETDITDFAFYRLYRSETSGSGYVPINGAMSRTWFTDNDVQVGRTYYYVLAVFDHVGNQGVFSTEVSGVPLNDVTPPAIYSVSPSTGYRSNSSINLKIQASDNVGVVNYRLEYSSDGQVWQAIYDGANSAATWDVSGLLSGTYDVRINVNDAENNASELTQSYAVNHEHPGAPENLRVSAAEVSLIIAWDSVVAADFHHYELRRAIADGDFEVILASTTSTVYIDNDVDYGSTYTYKVATVDSLGNISDPSLEVSGEPLNDATAPEVLSLSPMDGTYLSGEVTLTALATDNVQIDLFHFDYAPQGTDNWTSIGDDLSLAYTAHGSWEGSVAWNTENLDEGSYVIRATAVDYGSNTHFLAQTLIVDRGPPAAPQAPTVVNTRSGGTLQLNWSTVLDTALGGFNVYRSGVSGQDYILIGSTSQLSWNDTGLDNNVTYYYVTTAFDVAGNESVYSSESSGFPTAETDLVLTGLDFNPSIPVMGREGEIVVSIYNNGPADAKVDLCFYDGDAQTEILIGIVDQVNISAGNAVELNYPWMPETSGVHTITVQAENVTPVDIVPLNNGISDDQVVVNIAPVAIAGGNRTGDWNAQIEFDGTASNDEDGQVENYLWDFGDGKTSGHSVTSHAYMLPGIYTATLMVTDNRGASSVDTFQVEIIDTRSDLIVSASSWSPVEPQERDLVTITAAITNIGNGPTQSGFFATFYIDGMYRGYQRVNEILDIGDDHQVSFEWTATKGLHTLKIIADDIQDNIVERDENNNTSENPLTLQQIYFPDLTVKELICEIADPVVSSERPLTATATLENQGSADAFDFWACLYVDNELVTKRHVNELVVGDSEQINFQFQPQDGTHTLTVVVDDPVSYVLELDEDNNNLSLALAELSLAYPDLTVNNLHVLPHETVLTDGTSFDISVAVTNQGEVAVEHKFNVSFYLDGSYIGLREITELANGATQTVVIQTRATPGAHVVDVVIDEEAVVLESSEDNNRATHDIPEVTILYPDLLVSNVEWAPQEVKYGQEVFFTCTVSNTTVVSTLDTFLFKLYMDDVLVGAQELPRLTGHSSQPFILEWTANVDPTIDHTIKAIVDTSDKITEEDETNNELVMVERAFHVDDNFTLRLEPIGASVDEFGLLVYTSDQIAGFVATVSMGSNPQTRLGLEEGVEAHMTVIKKGAYHIDEQGQPTQDPDEVVIDNQPMTFFSEANTFHGSIDLNNYGKGSFVVHVTVGDGVDSASKSLAMTVIEQCNFTLVTDQEVYLRGQPVNITGTITSLNGEPITGQEVTIKIGEGALGGLTNGNLLADLFGTSSRTFSTWTDTNGNIDFIFQLLWGDAGHFTVSAFIKAPLVGCRAQTGFSILAANINPGKVNVTTSTNSTYTRTFTLENIGADELVGIQVSLIDEDPSDNVTAELAFASLESLRAGAKVPIALTVTIPEDAPDNASFVISLSTAEGCQEDARIDFSFYPATPVPTINPQQVKVGINPGAFHSETVTLTNVGMGTMSNITLVSPDILPWVILTGLGTDELAPGESTTFEILIAPPEDLQLGKYTDVITATDSANSGQMALTVEISSANRGSVYFVINNDAGQMVNAAEITLVSQQEFTINHLGKTSTYHNVYHTRSNEQGVTTIDDIPIGVYDYSITAPGHESVQNVVPVMPQSEAQIESVTLTAVPLSYNWTVTPITIEDTYEITLTLEFKTEIPKPEFMFLPPWLCIPHELDTYIFDQVIIVNPSLIELNDVTVTIVGAEGITVSSHGQIGTMQPQTSIVLGYQVESGDYAYLDGSSTYLFVTGTYVQYDPITLEQLDEEGVVEGKIPLVNPSSQKVSTKQEGETSEIYLPEAGDLALPEFPLSEGDEASTATAIVTLEIAQKATLEREGFDARLELTNGLDRELLSLSIIPRVVDEDGLDVTDRFYIVPPELENISAVNGSDNLDPLTTMKGKWILIPGEGLGGTELAGKSYWVKAVLSYYVDGQLKETQTNAVEITVHPQPKLYLHYYVPKDVIADEPFKLGLLIENQGDGYARNLRIDSGQPEIVCNESGLLVDFAIVGSSFGSTEKNIVRLVFGDIQPHSSINGYWIMTSSLDGEFTSFTAEFTHKTYKDIEINPLIVDVTTEIIEHDYLFADAQNPDNCFSLIDRDSDGFPDYMINLTTGLQLPILIPESSEVTKPATELDRTIELTVPEVAGYVCVILPDPLPDANIRSITRHGRNDGEDTFLSGNNFWKANGNIYFVDKLGVIDENGVTQPESGVYTIDMRSALVVNEVDCVPVEFNIVYGENILHLEGIIVNEPQGDSALTTYELEEPVFYIDVPPTEGQKAAVRVNIRNEGVIRESGIVDFYIQPPDEVEVLLNSVTITDLRAYGSEEIILDWIPGTSGLHMLTAKLQSDSPDNEMTREIWVNAKPYADAGADFFSAVSEPTKFDGTRSLDPDGFIYNFMWDFGDGIWEGGMGPTHVYEHSGTYWVHMIVKDDVGAMTEDIMQVTIEETRPDLIVQNITIWPETPQEGEEVTLTGRVQNIGVNAVNEDLFHVGFYVDGTYHNIQEVAEVIESDGFVEVSFTWTAEIGNHLFTFVVDDMMDRVDEADENNNRLSVALYPDQVYFPDLVVDDVTISISPEDPINWGDPIDITANVSNIGTADGGKFRINFTIDDLYVGYSTINALSDEQGANTASASISWTPTEGEHTIYVQLDAPISHVVELDEDNNDFTYDMPALNIIYGDLIVSDFQIWPPDGEVEYGHPLVAYVTVKNESNVDNPVGFSVSLRVDGQNVTTADVDGLAAGEEKTVRLLWVSEEGTYTLECMVDSGDSVPETDEDNNTSSISNFPVEVLYSDLTISNISIYGDLRLGENVVIVTRVTNQGTGYSGDPFNVRLLVNNEIIDVERITQNILAGSYDYWFADWRIQSSNPTQLTVTVIADANDEIQELDETNNSLTQQFDILPCYVLSLQADKTLYLTSEDVGLTLTVEDSVTGNRLGPSDDISSTLRVFDSSDSQVLEMPFSYLTLDEYFDAVVASGSLTADTYTVTALVEGPLQIQETSLEITVAEDFAIFVTTDQSTYRLGQPVVISGSVYWTDGSPISYETVDVYVNRNGSSRLFNTNTHADGTFNCIFQPFSTEGGQYSVKVKTTVNSLTRQASRLFTIEGLIVNPYNYNFEMVEGTDHTVNYELLNVGTFDHENIVIQIQPLTSEADISVTIDDSQISQQLSSGGISQFSVTFQAGSYTGEAEFGIVVSAVFDGQSFEGGTHTYVTVISGEPLYQVRPAEEAPDLDNIEYTVGPLVIDLGIKPGTVLDRYIILENVGYADMTGITITETQLPWVERIWSGQDTLVPQGNTNMLIRFTPPDSITPDIYYDEFFISSNAGTFEIQLNIEMSPGVLDAVINVINDWGMVVPDAMVILTLLESKYTDAVDPAVYNRCLYMDDVTDANGQVSFIDILAGRYQYEVFTDYHIYQTGTFEVYGLETRQFEIELKYEPLMLSLEPSKSTNLMNLEQLELGLVLTVSPDASLITDRPGAEYLILRNKKNLSNRLAYLDPWGKFPDNLSFSINNRTHEDIENVWITAGGDLADFIDMPYLWSITVPANGSVIVNYDFMNLPVDSERIIDGELYIDWDLETLTFPIRVRVADSENIHNGETYEYVPYSGPWPTGPILYGEDFIKEWFNGSDLSDYSDTGHGMSGVTLSQDVVMEGQAFILDAKFWNMLPDKNITVIRQWVEITDSAGENVTDQFGFSVVHLIDNIIPSYERVEGTWSIKPKYGIDLGGTNENGVVYTVRVGIEAEIDGHEGKVYTPTKTITVMPEPSFAVRYEVNEMKAEDGTILNSIEIVVHVDNIGHGIARELEISLPEFDIETSGYWIEGDPTLYFGDIPPQQTVPQSRSWILRFNERPDIAAIVSSLTPSIGQYFGANPAITFQMPVEYHFVSEYSIDDLTDQLATLLVYSKDKVQNELRTLAFAYDSLHFLLQYSEIMFSNEMLSIMQYAISQTFIDFINILFGAKNLVDHISDGVAEALLDSGLWQADLVTMTYNVATTGYGITGSAQLIANQALSILATRSDLEKLFSGMGDLITDKETNASNWLEYLKKNTNYQNLRSYRLTELISEVEQIESRNMLVGMMEEVISEGGRVIVGIDNLFNKLDKIVEETLILLQNLKITAIFPVEILHAELETLIRVMSSVNVGIGLPEEIRDSVNSIPVWYSVGDKGDWRPVFQQSWEFGTIYEHWDRLGDLEITQWENFSKHWELISQSYLAGFFVNSMSIASLPMGGWMSLGYGAALGSVPAQVMNNFQEQFELARNVENDTYARFIRELQAFMLTHQYETSGILRMFTDFQNHVDYIIQHNPIDPDVSIQLESIDFNDIVVSETGLIGVDWAEIVITNTCDLNLHVKPIITLTHSGSHLSTFEGSQITLSPNETGVSYAFLALPKSLFYGNNTGFDAEVTLVAWDPISLSRSQSGPFYSFFYVGNEEELSYYNQQDMSQPLGGMVGNEEHLVRNIQIGSNTNKLRLLLIHGDDADLDLHLYNSDDDHVGFSDTLGADEVGIANAEYTGSDQRYQFITINSVVPGEYRIEVIVNEADPDSNFAVSILEIPEYPAMLATSTERISITTNEAELELNLSALEWGVSHGIDNLQGSLGDLTDESGTPLVLSDSQVIFDQAAINLGEYTDLQLFLIFADPVVDGIYTGELIVTGNDAITGEQVEQTVQIIVEIDHLAPAIPQITVSHDAADTMPVSVDGVTDANVTVELYVDNNYFGNTHADEQGNFNFDGLLLGMGDFDIKARAIDAAGNTSDFCSVATLNSTVDPFAPMTNEILVGDKGMNGWYTSHVTLSLDPQDTGGSGIQNTQIAIGDAQWADYVGPVLITAEGITKVGFKKSVSNR